MTTNPNVLKKTLITIVIKTGTDINIDHPTDHIDAVTKKLTITQKSWSHRMKNEKRLKTLTRRAEQAAIVDIKTEIETENERDPVDTEAIIIEKIVTVIENDQDGTGTTTTIPMTLKSTQRTGTTTTTTMTTTLAIAPPAVKNGNIKIMTLIHGSYRHQNPLKTPTPLNAKPGTENGCSKNNKGEKPRRKPTAKGEGNRGLITGVAIIIAMDIVAARGEESVTNTRMRKVL